MKYKKIGVLMGGLSAERTVSLKSGRAVADALEDCGYDVTRIDATHYLDKQLRKAKIDAAFIALHGRFGEDGTVQGLLEMMRIPYTGSSLLSSALAMDKARTRDLLAMSGCSVAPGVLLTDPANIVPFTELSFPVVVKPAQEGSSVGVTIVKNQENYPSALELAFSCSSRVLVEQFVAGTEINVAVIDGHVVGAVEIETHREFYDYEAKYQQGGSIHHIPPRLPEDKIREANQLGARAYKLLGCSGAARVDLILPKNSTPIVLEVNTIPGMTPTSLLPEIAAHAGLSFRDLVSQLVESAQLHISV